MGKKLTYQQRFKGLWIAALLLLVISYKFSVSKTITEYQQFKEYKTADRQQAGAGSEQLLDAKNKQLTGLIDQFALDTLDNSKNLLGIVSSYCDAHHISLKEYRPSTLSAADTLRVLTRSVTVEGKFVDCLHLVHALETKFKAGKVCSVLFKSETSANNSRTFLYCTIYIQNLIMN